MAANEARGNEGGESEDGEVDVFHDAIDVWQIEEKERDVTEMRSIKESNEKHEDLKRDYDGMKKS